MKQITEMIAKEHNDYMTRAKTARERDAAIEVEASQQLLRRV